MPAATSRVVRRGGRRRNSSVPRLKITLPGEQIVLLSTIKVIIQRKDLLANENLTSRIHLQPSTYGFRLRLVIYLG